MKNTPKLVNISEPLWRALEVMSKQMGVDKDALVNQAVYALARMHGFITPPQVKVNDEAPHALDGIPEPMPSVKPGPPVPTPPEPPPTVPERGPMPSPPTLAMPAPKMSAPPAPVPPQASAPVPAAATARPDAPQGPSEADRIELRAKAIESMKAIAAEVERIVAVQADPPIGDDEDEDDDEEQDEADEAASEESEAPVDEQGDAPAPDEGEDASEAPSEQNAAPVAAESVDGPEDEEEPAEAGAPAPNGQAELQSDLESLGLGEGEEPKSDLSPLPELPEEDAGRDEPEGIPTALVRPNDVVGNAATALRPKHKKGDDSAGMATMGVHVNVPDRPDGAEEINVTGTVRRLALQIPRDREEEEPQERTQIVRKEKPRLFIIRGGADPVEIVSERYLIGRGPHCDLVIESNRVSREHAAVFNDDEDGFVVEDLGSSNGTWFKEERVQKHVISDGDEVFFGNEAVRFNLQAPGAGAKRGARRDGRVQA